MNRILAPEIGDRLAAAVAIRLHPNRRVALGELVRIIDIHSNNGRGRKATRPLPLV
jgi:hypothetical protein